MRHYQITLDNGVKATILRNENGRLKGFSFPRGSQLTFIYKKVPGLDYALPEGIKFIAPNGKEKVLRLADMVSQKRGVSFCQNVAFSKTSALLDPEADCQFAVAQAAANAAVACAYETPACVTATVIALVAGANAVRICRRIGGGAGDGGSGGDAGGGGSGGGWGDCDEDSDCVDDGHDW